MLLEGEFRDQTCQNDLPKRDKSDTKTLLLNVFIHTLTWSDSVNRYEKLALGRPKQKKRASERDPVEGEPVGKTPCQSASGSGGGSGESAVGKFPEKGSGQSAPVGGMAPKPT